MAASAGVRLAKPGLSPGLQGAPPLQHLADGGQLAEDNGAQRPGPHAEGLPQAVVVLALMAEGRSDGRVARRLVLSDGAVAKHVANVFLKLDLLPGEENRRVRAVLTWLRAHA